MATITDVPGVTAGHWTADDGTTGVTVVRTDAGARGGLWVPGSAPGSREWGTLAPDHLARDVHAVCLAGGSAFGLAAADGVMRTLAAAGIGLPTPGGPVPIVPAAILFDLDVGSAPPDASEGRAAAEACTDAPLPTGAVGAGAGARVGRGLGAPRPGGLGSAAVSVDDGTVGAIVALNAFGRVRDPATGAPLTHADLPPVVAPLGAREATTLVVVATDVPLGRGQARVVAKMASAGLARCLEPAFTPFDGDAVIVLSTTEGEVNPATLTRVGAAAAAVVEHAIVGLYRA